MNLWEEGHGLAAMVVSSHTGVHAPLADGYRVGDGYGRAEIPPRTPSAQHKTGARSYRSPRDVNLRRTRPCARD